MSGRAGSLAAWTLRAVVLLACGLPLATIAWTLLTHPHAWREAVTSLPIAGRTLAYAAAAATVATTLSLPIGVSAARAFGRRGVVAAWWGLAAVPLVWPSLAVGYAWSEALARLGVVPTPQSVGDVARAVWTIGAWLWPIPAFTTAVALRSVEPAVVEQAWLDGGTCGRRRVQASLTIPGVIAGWLVAFALAGQEFGVYDVTGISTTSTEARMAFETGATLDARAVAANQTQASRAAAATAATLPTAVPTLLTGLIGGTWAVRRAIALAADEPFALDDSRAPSLVRGGRFRPREWGVAASAIAAVLVTVGVPAAALLATAGGFPTPWGVWATFAPQWLATLAVSGSVAAAGLIVAVLASLSRPGAWLVTLASAAFLVGGTLFAIATIRLLNRPSTGVIYDQPEVVTAWAHVGRFAWVGLVAGLWTWAGVGRTLREQASVDGASAGGMWRAIVWPLSWPTLAAAGVLTGAFSLGEVAVSAMLTPATLVPTMLTWVHLMRFGPMAEASLVLSTLGALLAVIAGVVASGIGSARERRTRRGTSAVLAAAVCLIAGCDRADRPLAVWGETGRGDGQLVYPRAAAWSEVHQSLFIIDRTARVQRWDRDGQFVLGWQMPEERQGKPVGVGVGPDGRVYVADTHYGRVMVYEADGTFVRQIGRPGGAVGEFRWPTDVAFDDAGRMYVSEYGATRERQDRVQVFDADDRVVTSFGEYGSGPGEFNRPQSIVIIRHEVFVADAVNHRISVFDTHGRFLRTLGGVGGAPGEFRFPYGLSADARGRLIVCEFGNNRVQRIDPASGKSLGIWGGPGRTPGKLAHPWAAESVGDGRVAVVDAGNNRVQVVRFADRVR